MIGLEDFASVASVTIRELVNEVTLETGQFGARAVKDGLVVQVVFTPETGEWNLLLSQEGQSDPPFEVPDLLRLTDCPEDIWSPMATVISQDADAARRLLARATKALREFGMAYLSGDDRAFTAARQDRSERAATYTASVRLAPVIRRASDAWMAGDMSKVVELLAPYRGALPQDQERRLAFAERKLDGGSG